MKNKSAVSKKRGEDGMKRKSGNMSLKATKRGKKPENPQPKARRSSVSLPTGHKKTRQSLTAKKSTGAKPVIKPQKETKTKKEKSTEDAIPFKNFRLKPSAYAKWKPLSKLTEMFVNTILDTNIAHTLKSSEADDITQTQDTLNGLHSSLMRAVRGVKVPKPAVTSYRQLQATTTSLGAQLNQNQEQLERLDSALEEEERLTISLEKEMEQHEAVLNQSHTPTPKVQKVHPMLLPDQLALFPVQEPLPDRPPANATSDLKDLSAQAAAISTLIHQQTLSADTDNIADI